MTRLEIVNDVLIKLGQSVVSTVNDTKAARLCNAQYPQSVKALFESHPWDFAKKYTTLPTPLEHVTPDFGYMYAYDLPIDFCRFIEEEAQGYAYDLPQYRIYTNIRPFKFTYVALPTTADWDQVPDWDTVPVWSDLPGSTVALDELRLTQAATEALSYHIASRCSYGINGDHSDTRLFMQLFTDALPKAKALNAQQQRDQYLEATSDDSWVNSRV